MSEEMNQNCPSCSHPTHDGAKCSQCECDKSMATPETPAETPAQ